MRRRQIVFVEDASARIAEDACASCASSVPGLVQQGLRTLGVAACPALADRVMTLPAEQVVKGLFKPDGGGRSAIRPAADERDRRPAARRSVLEELEAVRRPDRHQPRPAVRADPLLRLATLLPLIDQRHVPRRRSCSCPTPSAGGWWAMGTVPRLVAWMSPKEMHRAVCKLSWNLLRPGNAGLGPVERPATPPSGARAAADGADLAGPEVSA